MHCRLGSLWQLCAWPFHSPWLALTLVRVHSLQVGSHYHFIETNKALLFDRAASLGCVRAQPIAPRSVHAPSHEHGPHEGASQCGELGAVSPNGLASFPRADGFKFMTPRGKGILVARRLSRPCMHGSRACGCRYRLNVPAGSSIRFEPGKRLRLSGPCVVSSFTTKQTSKLAGCVRHPVGRHSCRAHDETAFLKRSPAHCRNVPPPLMPHKERVRACEARRARWQVTVSAAKRRALGVWAVMRWVLDVSALRCFKLACAPTCIVRRNRFVSAGESKTITLVEIAGEKVRE